MSINAESRMFLKRLISCKSLSIIRSCSNSLNWSYCLLIYHVNKTIPWNGKNSSHSLCFFISTYFFIFLQLKYATWQRSKKSNRIWFYRNYTSNISEAGKLSITTSVCRKPFSLLFPQAEMFIQLVFRHSRLR